MVVDGEYFTTPTLNFNGTSWVNKVPYSKHASQSTLDIAADFVLQCSDTCVTTVGSSTIEISSTSNSMLIRITGTPFIHFVQTTNLTYSLSQNNEPVAPVINNPSVFPLPTGPNATYDVFNASTIVSTDTFVRCGTEALAYAGAATDTFPEVYYYENNRSYQIPYWPLFPLTALCDAVPDAAHPNGDPDKEYFKCHSV